MCTWSRTPWARAPTRTTASGSRGWNGRGRSSPARRWRSTSCSAGATARPSRRCCRSSRADAVRRLAVLALAFLAGGPEAVLAAPPSEEDDVFEAVFRQQVAELLDAEARASGVLLCLEVDPGGAAPQTVDREFLARLRDEASVRRGAECEVGTAR